MSQSAADLLGAFECHDAVEIRRILAAGVSPTDPIDGKRPIDCLIEMYTRSTRFAACLQAMLDAGAQLDPLLEVLLLDNADALPKLDTAKRITIISAYTSCRDVTPLHIAAEYNSLRCLRYLLENGADVNAPAGIDAHGIGGHTPIFHTVNSNSAYCRPAMELLAEAGARLDTRVNMVMWGETMSWETIVYDVTPVSYAQCGLYRQFHRPEPDVYSAIEFLWKKRFGQTPPLRNIPNQYLTRGY